MSTSLYATSLGEFEARLGPPDGDGPFNHRSSLACDEAEQFPPELLASVAGLGFEAFHVPPSEGGHFLSFEQILAAAFALARRDPSLALTLGMQSWFWLLWIAGSPEQKTEAHAMLREGSLPCFAASEAEHGADLLASETLAIRKEGAWQLSGEKWPIGSGGRAATAFVLARTRPAAGPRSLSWFSVDLAQPGVTRLPRVRTHGLRASDLRGLRFTRAEASLIGSEGQGLELTLKVFQITRPLMAALGLGTADTAVRVATRFGMGRRIYRGKATDLQAVRKALAGAWLDFLAAEILLLSTVRALHVCPEQMSIVSPLAKATAPWLLERAIRAAATVLGARSFLRDGETGIFQKMVRDHAATGLIDGSTPVCLHALAAELPQLLEVNEGRPERLTRRFALAEPVPVFSAAALELTARRSDDVTAAWPSELDGARKKLLSDRSPDRAPDRIDLARRYGLLHAAACCFQFARCNSDLALARDGTVAAAGRRLIASDAISDADLARTFDGLVDRVDRNCLLSVVDV